MQPRTPGLLWDIADAAEFVAAETSSVEFATYQRNRRLRQAIERNFEHDPAVAARIFGVPQIIAFRNVLAHGYDAIVDAKVWEIIQTFLPVLISEVRALLDTYQHEQTEPGSTD